MKKSEGKILLLPGDGIGPEVNKALKDVISSADSNTAINIEVEEDLVGGASYDKYNTPLTDDVLKKAISADAVILGSVGGYQYDKLPFEVKPERALLKLRKELDLYANIRPAKVFDALKDASSLKSEIVEGMDIVVLRELTGGIYFGKSGRESNGNFAFDTCEYNKKEIIRLAKKGFEIAGKRKKKLCCVDKANVLETSRLWRETIQSMEKEYPSIKVSYELVDAVAMRLIQSPQNYDVLVTENLFGDILTDEASVISGSMGLMPSASIGEVNSLYEPIHGSFPEATNKNIANPLATILSAAMMLEMSFNLKIESDLIKKSVEKSIREGFVTRDLSNGERFFYTSEVGDKICDYIKSS